MQEKDRAALSSQACPDADYLQRLQTQAERERRACVVGGVVVNPQREVFVQRRAPQRALFPGCWDIVGGHAEAGETIRQALAREITEETGWTLTRILRLVSILDWDSDQRGQKIPKREFDFLVEVAGDLAHPRIEPDKITEWRWMGEEELAALKKTKSGDGVAMLDLAQKALDMLSRVESP